LSARNFSATDGLSPDGMAIPLTSDSITSGASKPAAGQLQSHY
jgi:hypothetical protein